MRKPAFYICENKDADQLHSNCAADQRFCFRYMDSVIPLLSKSEISSLKPSSVAVQPGLCRTWSETQRPGFLTTRLKCTFLHLILIFFFLIFSDSRATFTSSFAGSESVFASKETGVSSIPSEMASIDEDKILCVSKQLCRLKFFPLSCCFHLLSKCGKFS